MEKRIFILAVVVTYLCCNTPDTISPCTLSHMSGQVKFGDTFLCNGDPSNHEFFECSVEITVIDSLISLRVASVDPMRGFTYSVDSLRYECVSYEPDYDPTRITFYIYDNNEIVGITDGKTKLGLSFTRYASCPNNSRFESFF